MAEVVVAGAGRAGEQAGGVVAVEEKDFAAWIAKEAGDEGCQVGALAATRGPTTIV
jgi:hypothetical protein